MIKHAFQINHLQGYAGFFPLGFELADMGQGIWRAYLHAQAVADAAEILALHAKERIIVFDVNHHWYDHNGQGMVTLDEIAKRQSVSSLALDKDVIVVPTARLPALLANFDHYNMSILDVGVNVDEDRMVDSVLKAMDIQWGKGESVLQLVSDSDMFLCSHDDCYLYVESRHLVHLRDHLRFLLRDYVSSRLGKLVSLPPDELVDDYLDREGSLTILDDRTEQVGGILVVPCSPEPFSFREDSGYPVAGRILVDVAASLWRFERAG